jgi:hypothetical protein
MTISAAALFGRIAVGKGFPAARRESMAFFY